MSSQWVAQCTPPNSKEKTCADCSIPFNGWGRNNDARKRPLQFARQTSSKNFWNEKTSCP